MYITKWKKPISKGYILHNSNYIIVWKIQSYGDSKKISDCQGIGRRKGWTGRAQRIFKAVKLHCMLLQWWILVITHFSKPKECTTPRMNSKVGCGLWAIILCPCMFINCNKHTTLVWELYSGGSYVWEEMRVCEKPLYFPLNFAVNLKLF